MSHSLASRRTYRSSNSRLHHVHECTSGFCFILVQTMCVHLRSKYDISLCLCMPAEVSRNPRDNVRRVSQATHGPAFSLSLSIRSFSTYTKVRTMRSSMCSAPGSTSRRGLRFRPTNPSEPLWYRATSVRDPSFRDSYIIVKQ